MDASHSNSRMLVWALAGFHTTVLMTVVIALLFSIGDLGRLFSAGDVWGTLLGLALFAALWIASCVGTSSALKPGLPALSMNGVCEALSRGSMGGAVTGGVFLAMLALGLIPYALVNTISEEGVGEGIGASLAFSIIFVGIGTVGAGLVGGFLGGIFGAIDWLLLWAARAIIGSASTEVAESKPAA